MPTLLPQISDAKILIQNFNAPNSPILPSTLPRPALAVNVQLPPKLAKPAPIVIDRSVHPSLPESRKMKQSFLIEKAFLAALHRFDSEKREFIDANGHLSYPSDAFPPPRVLTFSSTAEKTLDSIQIRRKIEKINQKISGISELYKSFKTRLTTKMKQLEFLLAHRSQPELGVIV